MFISRSRFHVVAGVLVSSFFVGCGGEEPTPKLFDESGTWSVIKYDLDGSGDLRDVDTNNRENAFMLNFDTGEKVVTAAACVENENETPASSTCLLTPGTTQWICHCYSYDYVDNQMAWREFEAGDVPPDVSLSDVENGAGDVMETDGGMATGDDTLVVVSNVESINSTYNFLPLPMGLFGSNGDNSRYVLQARANSVFDRVYEDPDGRPSCEPCVP